MMIFFIPGVLLPFMGWVLVLGIVLIPSLWLFFRFMNVFTVILGGIFEGIRDMFAAMFRKYISTFRNAGPLGKFLCIALGAAVVLWIVNWLRY